MIDKVNQSNVRPSREERKDIAISIIKSVVADYFRQDMTIYEDTTRRMEVVQVKHTAIYFIKKNTPITCTQLGAMFQMNHTGVIYVDKKISGILALDPEMKKDFEEIQRRISNEIENSQANEFYYINLDSFYSIKHPRGGAIILAGMSDEDLALFNMFFKDSAPIRKHENTGMYIKEKK